MSTVALGNCEALGHLCLIQAAARGTPFIYAPVPVGIDPRPGRWEHVYFAPRTPTRTARHRSTEAAAH